MSSFAIKPRTNLNKPNSFGLFTNKSFKTGDYIGFYDGEDMSKNDFALFYNQNNVKNYVVYPNNPDKIKIGYITQQSEFGIGQFINDSYELNFDDVPLNIKHMLNKMEIDEEIDNYIFNSTKKANVKIDIDSIDSNKINIIATRDIEVGEELYRHYGVDYWKTLYVKTCEYPIRKMCLFSEYLNSEIKNMTNKDCYKFMLGMGIDINNGSLLNDLGIKKSLNDKMKLYKILSILNENMKY